MIVCSNCGTQNPDGSAFCANCGTALSAEAGQAGQQTPTPQTQPQQQKPATSNKAIASLILGIVGLFLCGPFASIPGIILGKQELNAIAAGQSPPSNKSLAQAGYIVSIIVTALWLIYVVVFVLILGTGGFFYL